MMPADEDEDEVARRRRAEELRRAIDETAPRPTSPREFTDRAAREAAEEERGRRAEGDEDG
jgi:hypothetical protein